VTTERSDRLMLRMRAADPAIELPITPAPPLERVTAARRRRAARSVTRLGTTGAALAVVATLALANQGGDVIAQAAAALSGPEVLHTVSVTRTAGDQPAGKAESWRAPDGTQRSLLYSAGGELVGEVALRRGESLSWTAEDNVIYHSKSAALDEDPLTLLGRAKDAHAGVTQLDDTTVRGIPVHVIALDPTVAGEDEVPRRVYYVDKRTYLPVRIEFGDTVTDVLEAATIPVEQVRQKLTMSAHPGATRHDLRHGGATQPNTP
jgi:hypothetical protein